MRLASPFAAQVRGAVPVKVGASDWTGATLPQQVAKAARREEVDKASFTRGDQVHQEMVVSVQPG